MSCVFSCNTYIVHNENHLQAQINNKTNFVALRYFAVNFFFFFNFYWRAIIIIIRVKQRSKCATCAPARRQMETRFVDRTVDRDTPFPFRLHYCMSGGTKFRVERRNRVVCKNKKVILAKRTVNDVLLKLDS